MLTDDALRFNSAWAQKTVRTHCHIPVNKGLSWKTCEQHKPEMRTQQLTQGITKNYRLHTKGTCKQQARPKLALYYFRVSSVYRKPKGNFEGMLSYSFSPCSSDRFNGLDEHENAGKISRYLNFAGNGTCKESKFLAESPRRWPWYQTEKSFMWATYCQISMHQHATWVINIRWVAAAAFSSQSFLWFSYSPQNAY